ncbi:MAG: DUF4258 domain-containing protein [Desulfosalsimonadaceae bacterium]
MSKTFELIRHLIQQGRILVSEHGYDELAADDIFIKDVLAGINKGIIVEDYPDYSKGPCVLVLQRDVEGEPIHVVWGIPKGTSSPAVIVTAYRPDPKKWSSDFRRRKK